MTVTVTAPAVQAASSPKVTFDQLVGIKGPIPVTLYRPGKRRQGFDATIKRVHAPITPGCSTRLVDFANGDRRIMSTAEWRIRLRSN